MFTSKVGADMVGYYNMASGSCLFNEGGHQFFCKFTKLRFFFCSSLGCFQCIAISIMRYINNPLFDTTHAELVGTN